MTRSALLVHLLLAALMLGAGIGAPGASAQQQQPRKRFGSPGTVELGGNTTFTASQSVAGGKNGTWDYDFSLLPYAGYFVIEGLELGVNPAGVTVHRSGDTTDVQLRLLFAPSYNFRTTTIVTPFVEGLAGFTSASVIQTGSTHSNSGFTFGGRVGIKLALVERGMLNIGVQYLMITLNPPGATTRNGSNEFSVSAGWTVWL
ncbi:MAG TPA: hypothetical protein VK569_00120 [Bacteroidota bacterium]|nr:hypothetical protein [Bacteroidota bacterium]